MVPEPSPVQQTKAIGTSGTELDALRDVRVVRLASVSFFLVPQLQAQVEQHATYGMDVLLVSGAGPELARLRLGQRLRHVVVDFARPIRPWQDLRALWHLIRLLARERPQIVHSTTPKPGLLAAIAGFILRVPVRLHTFTGQPWVDRRGPVRWAARAADRLIVRLNSHCYADSASQRQYLIDEGIAPAHRISVPGGGSLAGVDTARFNRDRWPESMREEVRQQYGIGRNAKVLVFVGRITRDKGIQELLTAFEQLVLSGRDCHLLLIGPSDEECGGESFLFSSAPHAAARIHAVGYTDQPERYLAVADLLCLPSYREGFGTVVIEAAAMGVASVGSRINGLCDAIVDGETGVLIPPRDAGALYEALAGLLDAPERIAFLGDAARDRARRLFDANQVNRLVAEVYLRLLQQAGQIGPDKGASGPAGDS